MREGPCWQMIDRKNCKKGFLNRKFLMKDRLRKRYKASKMWRKEIVRLLKNIKNKVFWGISVPSSRVPGGYACGVVHLDVFQSHEELSHWKPGRTVVNLWQRVKKYSCCIRIRTLSFVLVTESLLHTFHRFRHIQLWTFALSICED